MGVCLFENIDGVAHLRGLEGTAFFVGKNGLFVTARHVIVGAQQRAEARKWEVGLAVKGENGKTSDECVAPISQIEFAPHPYDIAVGFAPYRPDTPLRFERQNIDVWQEVATLGYPLSAAVNEGEALWMNLRAHRGYVQRTTLPRDVPLGSHPPGIELSFLVGPGISGGPVFTVPGENVVGVAVGSNRSEIVDDSFVEVDDNGREFRETRLRIEQYGFAHQIKGILDWKPSILKGQTLLEAASL